MKAIASRPGNGITSGKKSSNKKQKKLVKKAPPKVEKTKPKAEAQNKAKATDTKFNIPKRKASEANVQAPSKKSKAANGNAAPSTRPQRPRSTKDDPHPSEGVTGKE